MKKILKKNRHGSHVGIIASFSIFVLFLIGIYLLTQPTIISKKDKEIFIDQIQSKIIEQLSAELVTVAVTNQSTFSSCIKINNNLIGVSNELGAISKVQNGNLIDSGEDSGYTIINQTNDRLLLVYYSEEFSKNTKTNNNCFEPKIEYVRKEKQLFESKIISAINNFDEFKKNVTTSTQSEYEMSFTLNNGSVVESGSREFQGDIVSKTISVRYLNNNSDLLSGKINLRVF